VRRREFITLVGAAAAWPLAARAQQSDKLPTIGFLGADSSAWGSRTTDFVQRLGQLGWIEGRTIAIRYRWTEGRSARLAEIAVEFARLKVDAIFTFADAVPALKEATSVIPIVFALARDPVGDGLVANLARPGGNVTGLSSQTAETAAKRLELLREVLPGLRRLAILASVPESLSEMGEVQDAARRLSLEGVPLEVRRAEDIAPAFAVLKADALYVVGSALIAANRTRIITLALGARLPTIFYTRDYVQAGALMCYGVNVSDQFRRAAELVDKILHGTKPGDIPVEQPTKFELVVNLTTAKAIGLTIPESFLALTDDIIE
jgi:putative ABC transport system substrate-binding protein